MGVCACNNDASKNEEKSIFDEKKDTTVAVAKKGKLADIKDKKNVFSFIYFLKLQRAIRKMVELKRKSAYNVEGYGKEYYSDTGVKPMMIRPGMDKNITYTGEYENGLKQGFGVQTWSDGASFKGLFLNNKANFMGIYQHVDKDIYMGEFRDDRARGFGMYKHFEGAWYQGQWADDAQNGIGIELWADKSEFKGVYVRGKKNGIGSYNWADGSSYQGFWSENTLHGFGIYKFIDGRVYAGEWNMNSMSGYGEFYWKDGKAYKGGYVNDKKEGFGIYYWAEPCRIYIGFWKGGRQHGLGKYISNRSIKWGKWIDGERSQWFDTKEIAFEANHVDINAYDYFFAMSMEDGMEFVKRGEIM